MHQGISSFAAFIAILFYSVEIFCSSLLALQNGAIRYRTDKMEPFHIRTVAFHSCDEGYYLKGNEQRTCTGDGLSVVGSWSGFAPNCTGTVGYILL